MLEALSVDVFPVFALEQAGQDEQHGEVKQHVSADAPVLQLVRVSRVSQEGDEILHLLVELRFGQRAGIGMMAS